jgi:hypothetical protein
MKIMPYENYCGYAMVAHFMPSMAMMARCNVPFVGLTLKECLQKPLNNVLLKSICLKLKHISLKIGTNRMKKTEKAEYAHGLYCQILEAKNAETTRAIFLGAIFKKIRDEELFKCLDSENFNQFLADPELGFQRSTVYSYIRLWEKYVGELNLDPEYLGEIGVKRLQLILPFVDKDPLEWLSRAQTWSYKDLLNSIRKEKGRQPMKETKEVPPTIGKKYTDFLEDHGCIFHKNRKAEKAHFPKTEKAGGLPHHVIPLCRECHQMYHDLGIVTFYEKAFYKDDFFNLYRNQIMDYFYELIDKLYDEIATLSDRVDGR